MLDTNFLIAAEEPGSNADTLLRSWLKAGERIGVCALVWAEYLCGPLPGEKIAAADALLRWKEPFDPADGPLAAHLFNATGRRRGTFVDCMIAATAIRCRARLATYTRDDFIPFEAHGLELA
jgi:predicted nucleic acid-binding protein